MSDPQSPNIDSAPDPTSQISQQETEGDSESDSEEGEQSATYTKPQQTSSVEPLKIKLNKIRGFNPDKYTIPDLQQLINEKFKANPYMNDYFKSLNPTPPKKQNKEYWEKKYTYIEDPEFVAGYNKYITMKGSGLIKGRKIIKGCGKVNENYRKVKHLLIDTTKLNNGVFSIMYEKKKI